MKLPPPSTTLFPYTTLFRSGVEQIIPVIAARTEAHLIVAAINRTERWQRIARQAAEQSRRSEEHTSELQSQSNLVCRLLLEKKKRSCLNSASRSNAGRMK